MALLLRVTIFCYFCFAVCGAVLPCVAQAADKPIRVTFLAPSLMEKDSFWEDYVSFMKVAAKSLGIDLTVMAAKDRFGVQDNAIKALSRAQKTDYLVYIYQAENTLDVLARSEKAGVKSFITNTDVVPTERYQAGHPREDFSQWIGHIFPDDVLAGRQLVEKLLERAADLNMAASDGRFHVVGIGGSRDSTASTFREKGFRNALAESPDAALDQYVLANWDPVIAHEKAGHLLEIHPKANIYWTASDGMALGVVDAMEEVGAIPGKDYLTGGIDWSPEGLEAVRNGKMVATIGGHFVEGAWVLALIYDYHHGKDFATSGVTMRSHMGLIDRDNAQSFLSFLDRNNWKKIDFKRFTKAHNPNLKEYDFSPDAIVRELSRK